MRIKVLRLLLDAIRGLLIGLAEIVPGVSGGTIALITGVYTTMIDAASHLVQGLLQGVRGQGLAMMSLWRRQPWHIVLPVLIGMAIGIVAGAALLEPVLEGYPVHTRAVFAGLILASLWIPLSLVGTAWSARLVLVALVAAAGSFVFTGLPALAENSGSWWLVAPAAALAVCALVLPGVSGSFLLVILGMYEPTLAAVNSRDFGYLGLFVLGAILGLGLFVRLLQYALTHHRVVTLAVMTGLMAGSLRALWPWQGSAGQLWPVPADSASVWWAMAGGAALVFSLVVAEKFWQRRVYSQAL